MVPRTSFDWYSLESLGIIPFSGHNWTKAFMKSYFNFNPTLNCFQASKKQCKILEKRFPCPTQCQNWRNQFCDMLGNFEYLIDFLAEMVLHVHDILCTLFIGIISWNHRSKYVQLYKVFGPIVQVAQVAVPLLMHSAGLPGGADVLWKALDEDFHSEDWRVRANIFSFFSYFSAITWNYKNAP